MISNKVSLDGTKAVICHIEINRGWFSLSPSVWRKHFRRNCGQTGPLFEIEDDRRRRIELERYLDLGRGVCHLRRPDIAGVIESALLFRHEVQYEMRAWTVMPNHVHALFLIKDTPMAHILDAWKGYTSKQANKLLGRKGKFWQDGYWDTYMRNAEQEMRTRRYIENNPSKAKLVASPRDWPFGSARFRDLYGRLCLPTT